MIVLDTSVAVAFMNRRDDEHERVVAWMKTVGEDLFTTPLIVAEIDHLVSRGGGLGVGSRRRVCGRLGPRWG